MSLFQPHAALCRSNCIQPCVSNSIIAIQLITRKLFNVKTHQAVVCQHWPALHATATGTGRQVATRGPWQSRFMTMALITGMSCASYGWWPVPVLTSCPASACACSGTAAVPVAVAVPTRSLRRSAAHRDTADIQAAHTGSPLSAHCVGADDPSHCHCASCSHCQSVSRGARIMGSL